MNPPTSLLKLGVDILEVLAEKVYEDKVENIQNLCLTSRAFRRPCQRQLFSEIHLYNGSYPLATPLPRLLLLHAILSGSVHLTRYTQTLVISQEFDGSMHLEEDEYFSWVDRNSALLATFLNLFATSSITTFRLTSDHQVLHWSRLDENLRNTFLAIFSMPTLRTLELTHMIISPLLLSPSVFPRVKNLRLERVFLELRRIQGTQTSTSVTQGDSGALTNAHINLELNPFKMDHRISLYEFVARAGIDLQTVRCLTIQLGRNVIPNLSLLIPSLRHLVDLGLTFNDLPKDLSESLNLSSLTALANLTIFHNFQRSLDYSLQWIIKELASIPSSHPHLLSVSVGLKFTYDNISMDRLSLLEALSDELQRLLHSPTSATLSRGRKIGLHLRPGCTPLFTPRLVLADPAFDPMKEVIRARFEWAEEDDAGHGKFTIDFTNQTRLKA